MDDEKSEAKPANDGPKPGKDGAKPDAKPPEPPAWLPLPKDLRDFLECTRDSVKLAGAGIDTSVKGVTTGFAEYGDKDPKKKKGHFKVTFTGLKDKMSLNVPDPLELDASVDKEGKFHIHVRDRTDLPQPIKDGIRDFVHAVNRFIAGKGKKLGAPETKDGKLQLEKIAVTSALLEKKSAGGFLAHLPTGEKVAGAVAVAALVIGAVALIGAGDSTTTVTKQVAVAGGGGGSGGPGPETSPPAEGVAEPARDVYIQNDGGPPVEGTLTAGVGGTVKIEVPLFTIGEHDTVQLWGSAGTVLDSFSFTVPDESGALPTIRTDKGGTAECVVDHAKPVLDGNSGETCQYVPPVALPSKKPAPAANDATVEPQSAPKTAAVTTTEETERPPYLPIGGLALAAAVIGGLVVDDERRRWVVTAGVNPGFPSDKKGPRQPWGIGAQSTIDESARTLHGQWAGQYDTVKSEYDVPLTLPPPGKDYSGHAAGVERPSTDDEDVEKPELAPSDDLSPKPYRPPPEVQ